MKSIIALFVFVGLFLSAQGFTVSSPKKHFTSTTRLFDLPESERREKLAKLGYSDEEVDRMIKEMDLGTGPSDPKVRVQEMEIDSVTLTAVGFGLIALNFFVFANMGDGGIAGVIATFMNTFGD